MTAGERFTTWIDSVAVFWSDRLQKWMGSWVSWGIELVLDAVGKKASLQLKPMLDKLEAETEIPPELKPLFDELKEPTGEWAAALGQQASGALIGGALGRVVDYILRPLTKGLSYSPLFHILEPPHLIALWRRGEMSDAALAGWLGWLGIGGDNVDWLKKLSEIRLDPSSTMTAWRRDPAAYEKYLKDLKDQGWDDDRIEALKLITQAYPALADVVRFYAKEAFEPDMIAKYGLDEETPAYEGTLFQKLGVSKEVSDLYWISHWEHATFMQMREMLHRGLLTGSKEAPEEPVGYGGWAARDAEGEAEMYEWYRVVEIPPIWRNLLTASLWNVPTRVDVRRWWDMRTISEEEMIGIYHRQGYHGKDLENYILWTKVYVAFPDLIARWTKGWITIDEVRSELTALGMPADRLEEFIQMKVKTGEPERVANERDLTKTDIYKGVKTGAITRDEGIELLTELGFDEEEADFLMEINIPLDQVDVVVKERELTKSDILKGLKTEVITRDEAGDRLLGLRYSPADAEFLLRIFDAQVSPPVEPKLREASKADILLGVKKGLITPEEGYSMLLDLGFTPEAADFILMVKAEESPFSPINFAEFKDLTKKYRRAAGMGIVETPEEIKKAAGVVVTLTGEVEALTRSIEEEKRGLIDQEALPEEATRRLKGLQVKRNRAESKLSAAKSDYDSLVAEWKHGQK